MVQGLAELLAHTGKPALMTQGMPVLVIVVTGSATMQSDIGTLLIKVTSENQAK
jgi:hypothetical protein